MRRKKDLNSFDGLKENIYLDNRGRGRKKVSAGAAIFGILGAICILYCICISVAGFGTKFFLVWGAIGLGMLAAAAVMASPGLMRAIPFWLKAGITGLFCLGVILFGTVLGMILSRYGASAAPGADYVIVLGAQWKSDGPSEVLRLRLDRAVEYLRSSPGTLVVVSGGQGSNEPVSEAAGMARYLEDAGIDPERIIKEDRSRNTCENLTFSKELLDSADGQVVIVTNNFHVFRAVKIAEKQGYKNAEGLAAGSVLWMNPNNLLREILGVVKDFLVGNL